MHDESTCFHLLCVDGYISRRPATERIGKEMTWGLVLRNKKPYGKHAIRRGTPLSSYAGIMIQMLVISYVR